MKYATEVKVEKIKNKMADGNQKVLTNGTNHSPEEKEIEGNKVL